jgi:hypothetical protein
MDVILRLLPSPHLLVLATSERFLSARGHFIVILASESHWLQPVLVLSVHWWPTPAGVGRVFVSSIMLHECFINQVLTFKYIPTNYVVQK